MILTLQIIIVVAAILLIILERIAKSRYAKNLFSISLILLAAASVIILPLIQEQYDNKTQYMKESQSETRDILARESQHTKVELQVKNLDSELQNDRWYSTVVANENDLLSFKVIYNNMSEEVQKDVCLYINWSEGLEYIPGSTMLYNSNHKDGIQLQSDGISDFEEGINIGNYKGGAAAVVTFNAKVKEGGFGLGTNVLRNWVWAYINLSAPAYVQDHVTDYADMLVMKTE